MYVTSKNVCIHCVCLYFCNHYVLTSSVSYSVPLFAAIWWFVSVLLCHQVYFVYVFSDQLIISFCWYLHSDCYTHPLLLFTSLISEWFVSFFDCDLLHCWPVCFVFTTRPHDSVSPCRNSIKRFWQDFNQCYNGYLWDKYKDGPDITHLSAKNYIITNMTVPFLVTF